MYLKYGLSSALIGASIAIAPAYHLTASALTAPEVSKVAKQVTVRIEYKTGGRNRQGSGIIIKQQGDRYYVLTAYHVVAEDAEYTLIAPDGQQYTLDNTNIKYKSGTDLAIVDFTSSKTYPVAKTGNSDDATEGSTVYVAGFPVSTSSVNTSQLYRFLEGKITANATQPLAEGYSLVYTNPTLGGMSGGPVLNDKGEVIGVHGRAETQAQSSGNGVKIGTTGNNLGISVNTFLRLALLETGAKAPTIKIDEPPKADDFYLQGADLERKKDYRGAIAAYDRALKINPKYAKAHFGKGYARIELGDYRQGIADYTRAIALDSKNPVAYHNRGIGYNNLKEYDRAIEDYDRAIALDPNYSQAYYSRGYARVELKQYTQGIADYTQTIALDSKNAAAYHNRGIAHSELKDYERAIENYDRAIALDPNYSRAYYSRAYARIELKQYPQGIADYTSAIAIDPNYPEAYYSRANARFDLKDYSEALADYSRAIANKPNFADAYNNRGNTRKKLGDNRQAISDYTQAIALNPNLANAYNNRGLARYEIGDVDAAITDWRKALSFFPNWGAPQLALAIALDRQNNRQEAFDLKQKAIATDSRLQDLQFLQENWFWGDNLLQDAAKFLKAQRF